MLIIRTFEKNKIKYYETNLAYLFIHLFIYNVIIFFSHFFHYFSVFITGVTEIFRYLSAGKLKGNQSNSNQVHNCKNTINKKVQWISESTFLMKLIKRT